MIMRKIPIVPVIINIAALAVIAGAMLFIVNQKNTTAPYAAAQSVVYHCPMHPNYLSHQPGKCPICGMDLVPVNYPAPQKTGGTGKILYYRDAMNPAHTSDTPGKAPDGMELVPVYEGEDNGSAVKIDPAMIQSMGVQTEKAAVRPLTKDIRTTATVMPDERRKTIITTKIMGYVEKLYVNYTGQQVRAGQPLYDLYSPDLVSAQSEYLQTYKNIAAGDSGQLLRSARQRLLNWDVTEAQISALEKRGVPEKSITIVSPAGGTVAEKMIVEGQSIEPGMPLYKIIDYSRVWVECALYQQDVPLVKTGQRGTIELDYYPGKQFGGSLIYISPELNMESRTLMVRFELANTADFKIKPGMNATVTLHAVINRNAVTVPDQAVIHSGLRTIVVIAMGGGYFEPREIKTGQTTGGYTEIIEGVNAGEEIVISSQFLIDSESNLKAAIMKMNGNKVKAATGTLRETTRPIVTTDQPVYVCPMHPEVISDIPGSCPKCGMDLVLKKPVTEPGKTASGMDGTKGM
jgi:multidrug efflux pump subunit AcrA (membrane-fusion protein)